MTDDVYTKDRMYNQGEIETKIEELRTALKDEARKVSALRWDGSELKESGTVTIGGEDVIVKSVMDAKVKTLADADDVHEERGGR